jgi:hypothetical protein
MRVEVILRPSRVRKARSTVGPTTEITGALPAALTVSVASASLALPKAFSTVALTVYAPAATPARVAAGISRRDWLLRVVWGAAGV